MNEYNVAEIREAMHVARAEAEKAKSLDGSDGGSCNMDFVYLSAFGMRNSTGLAINGKYPYKAGWHGRILKVYSGEGQASLNTRMCEAFLRSLRSAGLEAFIYYQLD